MSLFVNNGQLKYSAIMIYGLSLLAVAMAGLFIFFSLERLSVYNLVRSIIFSLVAIYLFKNPNSINYIGRQPDIANVNEKISRFLGIALSITNAFLSIIFFYEKIMHIS